MTSNKSFNQELFWLEQEDASDTEAYIPLDTPLHSPNFNKLKKRAIKTRLQHVHNKTIQKQINELKVLQRDFGNHVDSDSLPKNVRRGPVFELISGSKFVEKKADEIKSLLEYLRNKEETEDQNQQTRDDNNIIIKQRQQKITEENNKIETESIVYQNETLKIYSNVISTYRSGYRNQLSAIQKDYNNQILQVKDGLTSANEEHTINIEQKLIQTPSTAQKRVRYTDTSRDPRLKRVMQQQQQSQSPQQPEQQPQPQHPQHLQSPQQSQQQHPQLQQPQQQQQLQPQHPQYLQSLQQSQQQYSQLQQPQQQQQPQSQPQQQMNTNMSPIKKEPLNTANNSTSPMCHQQNSSNGDDSIKNRSSSSTNVDGKNQTLPSSSISTSSTQIKSSPSTVIAEPSIIDPNTYSLQNLEFDLKTLRGKHLSSTGTFELKEGMLVWQSRANSDHKLNLGFIEDYHNALKKFKNNDKSPGYKYTLTSLSQKGSAINCSQENGVPTFMYLPNLNKNSWLKVGRADYVMGQLKIKNNTTLK